MKIYFLIMFAFSLCVSQLMTADLDSERLSVHSVDFNDDFDGHCQMIIQQPKVNTFIEQSGGSIISNIEYPLDTSKQAIVHDVEEGVVVANHVSAEIERHSAQQAYIIQRDNEKTRRKQFMFLGVASIVRAVAIIQIAAAQYHNKFGTVLKAVASAHILYGIYLLLEPCCKSRVSEYIDPQLNNEARMASEMSSAKNYALTGVGDVIGGAAGLFFALAAPNDPLAPLAIVFGSQRLLVGGVSCVYPGYLMVKDTFSLNKCFSNKDMTANEVMSWEETEYRKKKKLERARLQQFLNTGIAHIVRGGAAFYLAPTMPSEQYANVLRFCGALELAYGLYALYEPFINAYYSCRESHNRAPVIEEGSQKSYILRAAGFIIATPLNIMYALGAPDAKTPWIVGFSTCSALFGFYSIWNPLCDHYGLESLKCKKMQIVPVN